MARLLVGPVLTFGIAALGLVGCGGSSEDSAPGASGGADGGAAQGLGGSGDSAGGAMTSGGTPGGGGAAGSGGAPGQGGTASGGTAGEGGAVGTGGVPGEGGTPAGGTAGQAGVPGEGGRPSGGTGGDGGTPSGGTGGDGGTPSVSDPIIPAPDGACPDLTSGTQIIMGLQTDILAGTPGSTPGPLLFNWHGTGSSGTIALNYQLPSSVRDDIVAQGGIIIAPNDDGTVREGTSPNGVWYETSDLLYADHIVACAVLNHNIDPRQIYVTGCSAGGLMAAAMAVKRSSYVAAVAPNSGGLATTWGVSLEDPSRVPAVMTMHGGTNDTVIINFQTTSETFANFIAPAGGFVVDCNHESGHCGAPTDLYESAWEFMLAHPFGTAPSPYVDGLPASFPAYCQIW